MALCVQPVPKRLLVASFPIALMIGLMTSSPAAALDHERGTAGTTARIAVIVTNREETIEYVNPAFESTTGYSAKGTIAEKWCQTMAKSRPTLGTRGSRACQTAQRNRPIDFSRMTRVQW